MPGLPISLEPNAFKWRRNIKHHGMGGMASEFRRNPFAARRPPRLRSNRAPQFHHLSVLLVGHSFASLASRGSANQNFTSTLSSILKS